MTQRTQTRPIMVGNIQIGGQDQVIIQSMTNTKTHDIAATVEQCHNLEKLGCQIIRFAIPTMEDAKAIKEIKKEIKMPIVADIHFDHHLALAAIEAGADAIRINPGNIGSLSKVKEVTMACQKHHLPIRIGINSGSLEKSELEKYGHVTPEGMIESAQRHLDILEQLDFKDICLSFKSSDVPTTIAVYQLASTRWNYPLHLGVTEAGPLVDSAIKSSLAMGSLLAQGIGDTIRVSVTGKPEEEIPVAKKILNNFHLIKNCPELISCPTCGRTSYDMLPIINEMEEYLNTIHTHIKVAIMGCAVNGPGEAREADLGVAGGVNEALLFRKGKIIKKIPQDQIVPVLKEEIQNYLKQNN